MVVYKALEEHFQRNRLIAKFFGISWDSVKESLNFDDQQLLIFLSRRINTKRYLFRAVGRIFHPFGISGPRGFIFLF